MIKNDHQLEITKAKLKQFEQALADLKTLEPPTTPNKKLRLQAHIDSRESCVEEFREDIASYEDNKRLDYELDRDALVSQIEEFRGETREYLASN